MSLTYIKNYKNNITSKKVILANINGVQKISN